MASKALGMASDALRDDGQRADDAQRAGDAQRGEMRLVGRLEVADPCGFSFDEVIMKYVGHLPHDDGTMPRNAPLHDIAVLLSGGNHDKAARDLEVLVRTAILASRDYGCVSADALSLLGDVVPAIPWKDAPHSFTLRFAPPTKTGKRRKYPLSVHLGSFSDRGDLIADIDYFPNGEPGKARIVIWSMVNRVKVGTLVEFSMDMGHLDPSCIEVSNPRVGFDWDRVWVREAR